MLQGIVDHQEFILEQDEFFLLSYNEKVIPVDIERETGVLPHVGRLVELDDRVAGYSTIYNDIIERSLLTLKMMSFYNGAVLASLTTSLPEAVGEVRTGIIITLLVAGCLHVHRDFFQDRSCLMQPANS